MSVTIAYDPRRGFAYSCPCGFSGHVPSVYRDAAMIEAHVRNCDAHTPTHAPSQADDRTPRRRNGNAKLDIEQVRAIRRRYADGETQTAIAADFGLSQPTIGAIVRRKTFSDVD